MENRKKEQILQMMEDQDVSTITIFKSQIDYSRKIDYINAQLKQLRLVSWSIMLILGIIPFMITLLYMILNMEPFLVKISFYMVRRKLVISDEVLN